MEAPLQVILQTNYLIVNIAKDVHYFDNNPSQGSVKVCLRCAACGFAVAAFLLCPAFALCGPRFVPLRTTLWSCVQILVISCVFSVVSISNCLANFEIMFNPNLGGLLKELLTMTFFFLDSLLRCLTFSAAIAAHSLGWLLFLLAYLLRSAALLAILQARGFIYAPKPPGEEGPRVATLLKHTGFSLAPAGLIQVMSDYPFNDLLAMSTLRIWALHVLSTWVEPAAATALILGIGAWDHAEQHCRLRTAVLCVMLLVAIAKSAMFACFYAPNKKHLKGMAVSPASNPHSDSSDDGPTDDITKGTP
jgi:hypothetical protein